MYFLLISILLNVALFLAFRTFTQWNIHVFQAVVINYLVCSIMGVFFLTGTSIAVIWPLQYTWHFIAIFLGFIFIGTFYLLGLTTHNFGITIATVSSKMSLIIPVIFGLYVFRTATDPFDFWNFLGIVLAMAAVVLTSIKDRKSSIKVPGHWTKRLLPLGLFLFAGTLDTTLNFVNYRYLTPESEVFFIWMIFISAALIGITILLTRWERLQLKSVWGGLYLGIPNFFSMYFIMKALSAFENNGAVMFPLFNMGIIIGCTVAAVTIFRERLLLINKMGIILAVISVMLISHRELLMWLK